MVQFESKKETGPGVANTTPELVITRNPDSQKALDIENPSIELKKYDVSFTQSDVIEVSSSSSERVFVASSPDSEGISYRFGPGDEKEVLKVAQLRTPYRNPYKARTADKIETREISDSLGLIQGTEWVDLSNHLSDRGYDIHFNHVSFSALPLSELLDPERDTKALIVENLEKGFKLTSDGMTFTLLTESEELQTLIGGSSVTVSPAEIETLLKRVSDSSFALTHSGIKNHEIQKTQFDSVIQALDDGIWYLKDTGGAKGNQVVKLEIKNGSLIDARASSLQHELAASHFGVEEDRLSPQMIVDFMYLGLNPHGSPIQNAILEKGIETIAIDGIRSEQRVIFAFNGDPYYLCSYSKVTEGTHSMPNLSQDGKGEAVRTSFRRILESKGLRDQELEDAIEDTTLRMKESAVSFSKAFIERTHEKGYLYGPHFGVDFCPVWNEEMSRIEFTLLEVQAGPGTEGARGNLPPEEEEAVLQYNSEQIDDYEYMC